MTSRTQQAPIAIALAMIAGRLEGQSAMIRSESSQPAPDKLRLANLATAVEDEATHLRGTAERVVDTLGRKPVTLTFVTLAGTVLAPRVEEHTIAVKNIRDIKPISPGAPVYEEGYRAQIRMHDDAFHYSTEAHETLVERIEGHGLARENRALREALRALVNDATTANRYAARKLLGDA